jgi:hypothetical protein
MELVIAGAESPHLLKKWSRSEKQISHPHPPKAGGSVGDDKVRCLRIKPESCKRDSSPRGLRSE